MRRDERLTLGLRTNSAVLLWINYATALCSSFLVFEITSEIALLVRVK